MTNREYIVQRLASFQVSDALLEDLSLGIDLDAQYVAGDGSVGLALLSAVEELVLAPSLSRVSEHGFTMSWDRGGVARWYLWLCRRYGATPDPEVLSLLGVSMIKDISDRW